MKVLIVEDDIISRQMLSSFLAPHGDCDMVSDGEEAVGSFEEALKTDTPYDLVLMDIMMPNMNGQEALKQIRKMEVLQGIAPDDEVKVIMITAVNDPKNIVEAFYKGGATSYIIKPIDGEKLINDIRNFGLIE
ncbi:MAG: response regulator [Thermodesulfobacteriota bacterium]|nr:response regulator [Thermodesulfobacteriota bacterium]